MNTLDGLNLAGKCPPEKEELEAAKERGFENVELYLTEEHLDRSETKNALAETDMNISTVHTPHVPFEDVKSDEKGYIEKADELAAENDAYLVFHSSLIPLNLISEVEDQIDFEADYGYENHSGSSIRHVENTILEKGHDIVLDTAHMFCAHEDYLDKIDTVLNEYCDQVGAMHFCDSYTDKDGIAFEEGEMDMASTYNKISGSDVDVPVVLEVMPEYQEEALDKCWGYSKRP